MTSHKGHSGKGVCVCNHVSSTDLGKGNACHITKRDRHKQTYIKTGLYRNSEMYTDSGNERQKGIYIQRRQMLRAQFGPYTISILRESQKIPLVISV